MFVKPASQLPALLILEASAIRLKRQAYNVLWNLLGAGVPMIASLFSIPILIGSLGTSRFGTLAVMMPILGYAGILDLGLSRALTKLTADKIALGQKEEIAEVFWAGAILTLSYGLIFGTALATFAPWLSHRALNIPLDIQGDVTQAIYLIALGLTVAVTSNAFRGILEGLGRFDLSNMVRVPTGIMLALGPLLVLPFTKSLTAIVAMLVAVRVLACLAQFVTCLFVVPEVRSGCPSCRYLRALSSFGGWVTVSNVVGQLLYYCDRFAAGRLLTMNEVAYLTTPQEISVQLLTIPNAVCGVLFPLFAQDFAGHSGRGIGRIKQGGQDVFLMMFPVSLALVLFARHGLDIWLNGQFAQHSANVLCWCAVALLFSSTTLVPYAAILGANRPDIPSKIYLAEAVPYVLGLWWLINQFGIQGAAFSFAFRTAIESAIFWVAAQRLVPPEAQLVRYFLKLLGFPAISLLVAGFVPMGAIGKAALLALASAFWLLVLRQSGAHHYIKRRIGFTSSVVNS